MTAAALLSMAAACSSDAGHKVDQKADQKAGQQVTASGSAVGNASSPAAPGTGSAAASSTVSPSAAKSSATRKSGNSASGGINEVVPSKKRVTKAPVPLNGTARFSSEVTAKLVAIKAVHGTAHGPGEVSGPALRIEVQLTNGTAHAIDLTQAVVTVTDAEGTPGVQLSQSGSAPFHGKLPAHASARGTYVFTLPTAHRDPVTVNFSYSSAAPVVLFVGDAK